MTQPDDLQPDGPAGTLVETEGVNAGSADATAEDPSTGADLDATGRGVRPAPEEPDGDRYAGAPGTDDRSTGQWQAESGQDSGSME